MLKKLILFCVAVAISAASANECENRFRSKAKTIFRDYQVENVFGHFHMVLSWAPRGVQVALIPRTREPVAPIKRVVAEVLRFYFGQDRVGHPGGREGSAAELHLMVNVRGIAMDQVAAKFQFFLNNLKEIPAPKTVNMTALHSDKTVRDRLERLRLAHFPDTHSRRFLTRAIQHLPAFVSALSPVDSLIVDDSVIDLDSPDDDQGLASFIEVVMLRKVDIPSIRMKLRAQFIEEMHREFMAEADYRLRYNRQQKSNETKGDSRPGDRYSWLLDWHFDMESPEIRYPSDDKNIPEAPIESGKFAFVATTGKVRAESPYMGGESVGPKIKNRTWNYWGGWNPPPKTATQKTEPAAPAPPIVSENALAPSTMLDIYSDDFVESTPLTDLELPAAVIDKLVILSDDVDGLGRYSARDLMEKGKLSRAELIALLKELNAFAMHIGFDSKWDRENYRIRKELPEYYRHRHVPFGSIIKWHMAVPLDQFDDIGLPRFRRAEK